MLYDVSSAAFEGRTCPLGAVGHPKDGVRGRLQIVYGLLTSTEGVPVVIEVFAGNTGDPTTVKSQVDKVKDRFGITRVVLVGDRGMLTAARLREDVAPEGLDWITALRAPQVKKLVRDGALQLLDAQTGSTGTREPLARGGQGGRLPGGLVPGGSRAAGWSGGGRGSAVRGRGGFGGPDGVQEGQVISVG